MVSPSCTICGSIVVGFVTIGYTNVFSLPALARCEKLPLPHPTRTQATMRSTIAARFINGIVLGCVITNPKVPSPSGQRCETSSADRSLLGHGKRKRSQASPHDRALCANQTD